jgi:hypothetical protein
MAKGRKRKDSADENVEAYRHETETRKNIVWTGKAENTSFEVPTVSLHIHERIAPEAIVRLFGGFGKWAFMEITDLWNAKGEIRKFTESDTLV